MQSLNKATIDKNQVANTTTSLYGEMELANVGNVTIFLDSIIRLRNTSLFLTRVGIR